MDKRLTWLYHAYDETGNRIGLLAVHCEPEKYTLFSYTSFDGYTLQQTRPPTTPMVLDLTDVASLLQGIDGAILFSPLPGSPYG